MNFSFNIQKISNLICKPVVDTIYPPVCFLCETMLPDNRKVVCQNCWSGLQLLTSKDIKELEKVIIKSNINNVHLLYDFTEVFQRIIHLLKYERCLSLCKYFVNDLLKTFSQDFFFSYDYIAAVPLHPAKYRERGYNQSYEIIKLLPGIIKNNLIIRKKMTKSQTQLTREERINNVANAFKCVDHLNSKNILLFDDIITTGSTINECASELKNCGAMNVDVLCLAAPLKHA